MLWFPELATIPHLVIGSFSIMITGWYYLHTNGDLIFKHNLPGTAADIRESDFAVMLWPADTDNRESAWRILVEALACGANLERVKELAAKWGSYYWMPDGQSPAILYVHTYCVDTVEIPLARRKSESGKLLRRGLFRWPCCIEVDLAYTILHGDNGKGSGQGQQ